MLKKILSNKKALVLIVAILVRLVLASITYHPDFRTIVYGGFLVGVKSNIINFYDFHADLADGSPFLNIYPRNNLNYPPLAYIFTGIPIFIYKLLFGNSFLNDFLLHTNQLVGTGSLFYLLLILKLPFIAVDIVTGLVFSRLFELEKGRLVALIAWLFNPITLFATISMGQVDILMTLSVLLALFFAQKNRKYPAMVCLGLGGAVKMMPILLIPIFAIVLGKKSVEKIYLLFAGLCAYLAITLPYLLLSPAYRAFALLTNQTEKMFYMKLPVTSVEGIPVFALGYFLIVFYAIGKKVDKSQLIKLSFFVFLLFFSVTHYHPQWFLWTSPFLLWTLIKYKKKYLFHVLVLFLVFLVHWLFFESSLHIGLFSPIFPNLLNYSEVKLPFIDGFMLKNIARAGFAAAAIDLVVKLRKSV